LRQELATRGPAVKPFWHPLSTVLLEQPRCFATDGLVRLLLAREGRLPLIYAGDRMWPALEHGAPFVVELPGATPLVVGQLLLVSRSGIPDVLRVTGLEGSSIELRGDADPAPPIVLPREAILAQLPLPRPIRARQWVGLRRLALDLREAWTAAADRRGDPAETVREKYESQAAHYARSAAEEIDPALLAGIRERVPAGRPMLVVGSGVGRECFALAQAGWQVVGIEFSPAMIALSRAERDRRGLAVDFRQVDIRAHRLDAASLGGVLFTYDVYSFLPFRRERVAQLRRLRGALAPGGVLFLSARRLYRPYDRAILSLQWLAQQRCASAEWGDSHARFIPNDGQLRRSFVHVFSPAGLRYEIELAGFRMGPWLGSHCPLVPRTAAMIAR